MIHLRSRVLDELDGRAKRAMATRLDLGAAKLQSLAASLSALSPLNVLTRGYSVTLDESGEAVTDANKLVPGEIIRTRLQRGEVESVVQETRRSVEP
jgi:exodeoxyribonuclease VII large subunit